MWAHGPPPGWDISQNMKAEGYSHSQAHDAGIQSKRGNSKQRKKDQCFKSCTWVPERQYSPKASFLSSIQPHPREWTGKALSLAG